MWPFHPTQALRELAATVQQVLAARDAQDRWND